MASAHGHVPIRFLRTLFQPIDWVAIVLKSYEHSGVAQRVGPLSWVQSELCQQWLRAMNARKYNIFVSVNAIAVGRRSRTRDAIGAVRHVFLDADHEGSAVLARLEERADLPNPSYVLHSSPGHVHVFWRVTAFDRDSVERLQKRLARELQTDPAATPVTQTTRLPGFFNHKRAQPHLVTIDYRNVDVHYRPGDFPTAMEAPAWQQSIRPLRSPLDVPTLDRAKRYLASVPPAIAGQHGDVHTFRICCRLVRGFALNDGQALHALEDWNARCQPPWSPEELLDKLRRAARYGREPVGGLL
jgi:DNA primase RepB-like protein